MRIDCVDDCVTAADAIARALAAQKFRKREFSRAPYQPPKTWPRVYDAPIGPRRQVVIEIPNFLSLRHDHPVDPSTGSRSPAVRLIINVCADHFNISAFDILSQRRTWNIVRPRQIAMYLAKKLTPRSLPDIGRRFGGRDHTTCIHAIQRIEGFMAADAAFAAAVAEIESAIMAKLAG